MSRKKRININKQNVYDALNDCKIIEFNLTCKPGLNCARILLRNNKIKYRYIDGMREATNLCLVIDISQLSVVTSYLNISEDNHNNINWDRYTDTLDIITIARMLGGKPQ